MHCQHLTKFGCAGVRAGADKRLVADSLPLIRGLLLAFVTTVQTGVLCNACLRGPAIHGRIYDLHPAKVGSASRRADNRPMPDHRDYPEARREPRSQSIRNRKNCIAVFGAVVIATSMISDACG